MASTYNYLGIEKMATGENAGTWGTKTNTNLDIIQQAASGYHSQTIAGGAQTTALLMTDGDATSVADALTNAARNTVIELTGTITGNQIVTFPTATEGLKVVFNNTSGSYTVQLKGASDSGSGTTFATDDKTKKLVYMSGTDLIEVSLAGTVTASSTTTFTNKTLTAPKFADGGFIADANGNESLVFGTTTSAVNEVKLTNAATGTDGPIIASQGETNSNLQLRPAGSGKITVGSAAANATVSSNGAYDLVLETNEGTNSGNITITDAANGNIALAPNGTGEVLVGSGSADGDITSSGAYDLILDTNSGTNAGNITLTDGANGNIEFTNNGTGVVKFNDAAYYPEADLTFDASQDWDVQASPVAKVTLTANVTFDEPSNPTTGQFVSILCIQDGGGSNTISWNAVFEFAADTAPTATTTGDKADLFSFRYNGAKWLSVGTTLDLTVA